MLTWRVGSDYRFIATVQPQSFLTCYVFFLNCRETDENTVKNAGLVRKISKAHPTDCALVLDQMIYYFGQGQLQFEIPIMASIALSLSFCLVPLNYPQDPQKQRE